MRINQRIGIWIMTITSVVYFLLFSIVNRTQIETMAFNEQSPVTVVIDAGHGGEDGGAVSVSGIRESEINLSIALKLEQLLSALGVPVSMVRSTDQSVATNGDTIRERKIADLKNRVNMINTTPNAVAISIHQNHFPEEKYSGAQVFYANTAGSKEFATLAQSKLKEATDPSNRREIKQAETVYLMKNIECPAILVECGFLSNIAEARLLQDNNYQRKLICALAGAVTQFVIEKEIEHEV